MRLHTIYYTALAVLLSGQLQAQSARWEGGFLAGLSGYQGELTATMLPELDETGGLYGFLVRYYPHPEWALRTNLTYTSFSGEDLPRFTNRNYQFQSTVGTATVALEWEPFGQRRYPGSRQFKRIFSPYFYLGAGWMAYTADATFERANAEFKAPEVEQDRSQTYPKNSFLLPVGIGIKADVTRSMVLGFEFSTAAAFTDLLDGISQAGNPATNDWMPSAALTVTFRLLPKDQDKDGIADEEDRCPQIKGNWSALGCPDEDGDGVEDLEDLCLGEPGLPRLNGCPDSDGDGIADREDRCPKVWGSTHTEGCPDTDADGLADLDDHCPRLPGPKGRLGCPPLDTDADGTLADEALRCQASPELESLKALEDNFMPFFEWLKRLTPAPKSPPEDISLPVLPYQQAPGVFNF
ncbi:MAG: DUF6089 family protein [Phaeodactylibacter sp.]|uniref:DUF6089 family protein n=1 Tax=Phaeodactylibacter sp. TaxID=1940289 RepID=UPI0032EC2302